MGFRVEGSAGRWRCHSLPTQGPLQEKSFAAARAVAATGKKHVVLRRWPTTVSSAVFGWIRPLS